MTNDIMPIYLYNTETRKKEKFETIEKGVVRFYSCGQTIYDDVHVGNAKTYVAWDVLYRFLKHIGYDVKHIQNITDVGHLTDDADAGEDKIERRARERQEDPMQLVDRQIKNYWRDMDAINVHRPDISPRATGHITEMIELVEILLEKGYAYNVDDSIYFNTEKFEDYGKMARLNLENQEVGVRDEVKIIEDKKNPRDFALWIKAPPEHIMKYQSPWGKGYPGWHIECSVMAMKYLGDTLDIHGGGVDHIPVHHTNEIAQSEAATGRKFVNYWLHSEFITLNGDKMSKSTGNFILLRDLLDEFGPGATRLALTQAQYRTQADFSKEKASAAQKRLDRLTRAYQFAQQSLAAYGEKIDPNVSMNDEFLTRFNESMADDLNTPLAFTVINEIVNHLDESRENADYSKMKGLMELFDQLINVLGVPIVRLENDEIEYINKLVQFRLDLRSEKRWGEADAIRDFLNSLKYNLNDVSKEKTEWFRMDHH